MSPAPLEALQLLGVSQKKFILLLHKKFKNLTLGQPIELAFLLAYARRLLLQVEQQQISHQTFKQYFSILRAYFKVSGWSLDPFANKELQLLCTYRLRRLPRMYKYSDRLTITTLVLKKVCEKVKANGYRHDEVVVTTLSLVAFFGLARTYELLHPLTYKATMSWHNVHTTVTGDYRILLSHPKIAKSYAQCIQPMRHDGIINPHTWLTILKDYTDGRKDMWSLTDGTRLTTNSFLVSFARLAGVYSSGLDRSSFRAGGATYLLHQQYSHSFIKTFGRWDSEAFTVYLRCLPDAFYNATPQISN
jgi:hypothetical protein